MIVSIPEGNECGSKQRDSSRHQLVRVQDAVFGFAGLWDRAQTLLISVNPATGTLAVEKLHLNVPPQGIADRLEDPVAIGLIPSEHRHRHTIDPCSTHPLQEMEILFGESPAVNNESVPR